MGLLTNFLELFKYDPSTDGLDTFNVKTALNENWDKIDAKAEATENSLNNHKDDGTIHHTMEAIQDVVGNLIQAGSNVSVTYDDENNQIQISSSYTDTNTQRSDEEIRDLTATFIKAGSNVSISHNDSGNELTITADLSASSILSKLKTVDGAGSGVDADLLDGKHASAFQLAGNYQPAGTYNTVIGTDSDVNTSGATIIDNIFMTDGVITSHGTRTLTPANIGALASGGTAVNSDKVDGKHASGTLATSEKYNLVTAINELFTDVDSGKNTVASAITDKGVATSGSDSFSTMASKIDSIPLGGIESVQRGISTIANDGGVYSVDINISGVDLTRSIVKINGVRGPQQLDEAQVPVGCFFKDSSTITLISNEYQGDAYTWIKVSWEVIQFKVVANLQSGTTYLDDSDDYQNVTINSVNTSKTILFFSRRSQIVYDSPRMGDITITGTLLSSTSLRFEREFSFDDLRLQIYWFVVEFD